MGEIRLSLTCVIETVLGFELAWNTVTS
jgi:hypothetical protein